MSRETRHAPFSRSWPELLSFAWRNRLHPTKAEAVFWAFVKGRPGPDNFGVRCRREQVLCGYIADFYVPAWKLVIEIDGSFHEQRADYDRRRSEWLREQGYRVIRLRNDDVLANPRGVVDRIKNAYSGSA